MNSAPLNPISNSSASRLMTTNGQASEVRQTSPDVAGLSGKWLPSILLGVYFLSLWNPPHLPLQELRWYMVLGLAILAFILQKSSLNLRALSVFWVVYGLGFLGAVLSLLRAPNLDLALWNTVGLGIAFISYLLFLPILGTQRARKLLLILLIAASILWTFEIRQLVNRHGVLLYSTFQETGGDKNHIGFNLSLAGTTLFFIAVIWDPPVKLKKWVIAVLRLGLISISLLMFFSMTLIYDRSGILTSIASITAVFFVKLIRSQNKSRSLLGIFLLVLTIIVAAIWLSTRVQTTSPYWEIFIDRLQDEGIASTFIHRDILLRKGWFIVRENPVIGVGPGGSRASISSLYGEFPGFLIHNSYLTDWAERGLLGLVSNIVWLGLYLRLLKNKFYDLTFIDQIWTILLIPLFIHMNFGDISSISVTMLAIMAGIYYEQYHIESHF